MEQFQITLKRGEDIQAFYDDMETPGGALHIPDRQVVCEQRMATSRTTGYMLTKEEAEKVGNDPRVEMVTPQIVIDRIKTKPVNTFEGRFDKSDPPTGATAFTKADGSTGITYNVSHRSWGILRHTETVNRNAWHATAGSANRYHDETVTLSASGRHVDIVVLENDTLYPHEDYNDRVIDYNWGQHFNTISGGMFPNYVYSHADARDNFADADNHPTSVTSYAAGKLYGPAKNANIYQFSQSYESAKIQAEGATDGGGFYVNSHRAFAYIREFHANKPINPVTGRKNPTIVNVSLGSEVYVTTPIAAGEFRGVAWDDGAGGSMSEADLQTRGIYNNDTGYSSSSNFVLNGYGILSDLVDAIAEGVIVVTASGNENRYVDIPEGQDYDNWVVDQNSYANKDYFFAGSYPFRMYYHRGDQWNGSGAINVGSLSHYIESSFERKSLFSNWGPGIDIYAAGENVIAAAEPGAINFGIPYPGQEANTPDWDTIAFSQGTSYSSPLVCGFLACLLEIYPSLTNAQCLSWLKGNSITGLMYNPAIAINIQDENRVSVDGSSIDRMLKRKNHKKVVGYTANNTYGFAGRPASGAVYPRVKKLLKG